MKKYMDKKQLRDFGLLIGFLFPSIFGFLIPYLYSHDFRLWTLAVGFSLIIFALVAPLKLKSIYDKWISIGYLLGNINSVLILSLIFIFLMQPMALIMRLLKYDPLKRAFNKNKSYKEPNKDAIVNLEKIF